MIDSEAIREMSETVGAFLVGLAVAAGFAWAFLKRRRRI